MPFPIKGEGKVSFFLNMMEEILFHKTLKECTIDNLSLFTSFSLAFESPMKSPPFKIKKEKENQTDTNNHVSIVKRNSKMSVKRLIP